MENAKALKWETIRLWNDVPLVLGDVSPFTTCHGQEMSCHIKKHVEPTWAAVGNKTQNWCAIVLHVLLLLMYVYGCTVYIEYSLTHSHNDDPS